MSDIIPPKIAIFIAFLLGFALFGCSHQKTQRGHLLRGDWAVEYNRTPWIGMPPDSVYQEVNDEKGPPPLHSLFSCLGNKDDKDKNRKRFRHHCAQNTECSAKEPCCRTLGCGMWVDPDDPAAMQQATFGGAAVACGLLPFCTTQKPCCLTPNCGRPANVNVNPQTLMMANPNANMPGAGMPGRNVLQGVAPGNAASVQNSTVQNGMGIGMGVVRGMSPTGMPSTGMMPNAAVSGGTLVSRGIVPGASAVSTGGMVAAIGVATPAGTMTPTGVRMPNGAVSNALVLRACTITQHCSAARPCGLMPGCGGAVAVNMVATNATVLASALQAQGVASGVMQANGMGMGGMGMLVNPMTNQPVPGLTMSGYPQVGYPPIGYAPSGYAPGYPRYMAGMIDADEAEEEHDEEAVAPPQETRSNMPVPRFHPMPTQPAFQRSEGMPPTQRTSAMQTSSMTGQRGVSDVELEAALDQAYLQGVSAAMDEVERKLDEKRQAVARARLQEKILQQSESLQQQLNAQEEMRLLAMQRERQIQQQTLLQQQAFLQQQALRQQTAMQAMATPNSHASIMPVQLAENLKTSVVSGMNEIFAPLIGSNQPSPMQTQSLQRGQAPAMTQPRQTAAVPKAELAAVQTDLPGRPPVSPHLPHYGLLNDDESPIMQARFREEGGVVRP